MSNPFISHSEITDAIYIVCGTKKYDVTEQVIRAMMKTRRLEQQRQHGEWIPINIHGETWEYKCSICGAEVDTDFPNCPYCLANMQKDDRKNAVQGRGEKS